MIFGAAKTEDATVVGLIAGALRRDISFGTLPPDGKLKIADLRARYGGSNHSIREALRLLTAEGLVAAEAQRGFRVTSATQADLEDITRIRVEVERIGLTWALANGDTAWEGRVMAAHHALRKAEDAIAAHADDLAALAWDEALRAFFAALMSASGSPRLIEAHETYYDQSRRIRLSALREGTLNFAARRARHAALVEAVLARDEAAALTALTHEIQGELAGT